MVIGRLDLHNAVLVDTRRVAAKLPATWPARTAREAGAVLVGAVAPLMLKMGEPGREINRAGE